jgi:hypothetical protein
MRIGRPDASGVAGAAAAAGDGDDRGLRGLRAPPRAGEAPAARFFVIARDKGLKKGAQPWRKMER